MGNNNSALLSCAGTTPKKTHTTLPSKPSPAKDSNKLKRKRTDIPVTNHGRNNEESDSLIVDSRLDELTEKEPRNAADGLSDEVEIQETVLSLDEPADVDIHEAFPLHPSDVSAEEIHLSHIPELKQNDCLPFVDDDEGDINDALSDANSVSIADSQEHIPRDISLARSANIVTVLQQSSQTKELDESEQNCCKFHSSESLAR